jgi:hypothetical protein
MKKILLALAMIGVIHFNADAQAKKKSVYAKNYHICLTDSKYKVCKSSVAKKNNTIGRKLAVNNPEPSLAMMDTYVHLGYAPGYSNKHNPRIRVAIDDPNAPYQGKESMQNDGVQKNKERNINYLDNSVVLPPNDGGVSDR